MATYSYCVEKEPEIMILPHEGHVHAVVRQVWFRTSEDLEKWLAVGDRKEKYRWGGLLPPIEL